MDLTVEEKQLIADRRKAAQAAAFDHADEDTVLDPKPAAPAPPAGAGTVQPPAPELYTHNRFLHQTARQFGMSEAQIAETPPEVLEARVSAIQEERLRRADAVQRDLDRSPRPAPPPPPPAAKGPAEDDITTADLGIPEGVVWDDATIAVLKHGERKRRALEKEIQDLKGGVQQTQAVLQKQETDRLTRQYDQLFAGCGRAELGTGSFAEIQGTEVMDRRLAVFMAAERMDHSVPLKQRFQAAVERLYGKPPAADPKAPAGYGAEASQRRPAPRGRAAPTEGDYEAGQVARPTSRRGAGEPKGARRAEQAVRDQMREQGISEEFDPTDAADDDGFL